jgi:hypothetical protein
MERLYTSVSEIHHMPESSLDKMRMTCRYRLWSMLWDTIQKPEEMNRVKRLIQCIHSHSTLSVKSFALGVLDYRRGTLSNKPS